MSMIGLGMMPFLIYYLYAVVPLAPLVYLFLKWRAYRDGAAADPWLGAAVLLQYFLDAGPAPGALRHDAVRRRPDRREYGQ